MLENLLGSNEKNFFINPVHGNEPYILGVKIAVEIKKLYSENIKIIVPHIYGDRQKNILREELGIEDNFSLEDFGVILDKDLGDFYSSILFKDNNFSLYLQDLKDNLKDVQKNVSDFLFNKYGDIFLELNTGSKFSLSSDNTFKAYAFPILFSELLKNVLQEEDNLGFDNNLLSVVCDLSSDLEKNLDVIYIPFANTFSFKEELRDRSEKEVYTPPLKSAEEKNIIISDKKSVFTMFSGTGSEIETMIKITKDYLDRGHDVFIPTWAKDRVDSISKNHFKNIFLGVPQDIFKTRKLEAIIGRAGWGTMWLSQVYGIDFIPIEYSYNDDPEIYYNIKTLKKIDIGELTRKQKDIRTDLDGISFVSQDIFNKLKQRKV